MFYCDIFNFFIAFSFGDLLDELPESCTDLLPYEAINEADGIPDEEQLQIICM